MANYYLADILGTSLRLAKNGVSHVGSPESTDEVLYLKGSYYPVYSYVMRNGQYWWETDYKTSPGGRARYMKHEEGLFVPPSGTKTTDEQRKADEDKDKPWYEKLGEGITGTIEEVAIVGIVLYFGYKSFDSYNNGKKS